MQRLRPAVFATVAIATVFGLAGCATKSYVTEQLIAEGEATDAEQEKMRVSLNQHETRLDQLDKTTKEALDRAVAAGKVAEGKFLYSIQLSDDSVKFVADSATLTPEAEQRLSAFADKLKNDNRNVYLEIQGHTDASGPDMVNESLGEKRAEAVRKFMNQHGVPLNRMATISYGEKDPVADNKTRDGRAQNRRVVLVVMS